MSIGDLLTVLGYTFTVFSAGIAVGKYISHNKNDRQ